MMRDLLRTRMVASYDTAGDARDVAIVGDLVYVATHRGGVAVLRLAPRPTPFPAATRERLGHTAYLPFAFQAPACP